MGRNICRVYSFAQLSFIWVEQCVLGCLRERWVKKRGYLSDMNVVPGPTKLLSVVCGGFCWLSACSEELCEVVHRGLDEDGSVIFRTSGVSSRPLVYFSWFICALLPIITTDNLNTFSYSAPTASGSIPLKAINIITSHLGADATRSLSGSCRSLSYVLGQSASINSTPGFLFPFSHSWSFFPFLWNGQSMSVPRLR